MVSALLPVTVTQAETTRRGKRLVGPVDLHLSGEGLTAVLGPNGSGKTSLLRLLHGTARLTAGRILWACPTPQARARQAFVFQRPVMLDRSVQDNLIYPLRLRQMPRAAAVAQAQIWAERVGLAAMLSRPAPSLSGGEQQKLALARALITQPELLFLDEPCSALDGRATRAFEAILTQAVASGTRVLLATHDMGQARRLSREVVFMLRGRVHEASPSDRFFARPDTAEARAFLQGDIVE